MIRLTVEETNLLSIYNEGGKRALIENVNAALPYICLLYTSTRLSPISRKRNITMYAYIYPARKRQAIGFPTRQKPTR